MTICPIAIAVGCKKCPAFSICPLKSKLGDFKKDPPAPAVAPPASARARRKRAK